MDSLLATCKHLRENPELSATLKRDPTDSKRGWKFILVAFPENEKRAAQRVELIEQGQLAPEVRAERQPPR
jgi:hypothetical protein